jgi:hypothetical protein
MAAGERQLTRTLDALDERLDLVEHELDQQLRREHWGQEPERLPAWRSRTRSRDPHAHRRIGTSASAIGELAAVTVT